MTIGAVRAINADRSISATASLTNHAKWSAGSHSRTSGGNKKSLLTATLMKFCAIPECSLTGLDGPVCATAVGAARGQW
jgi:hypothetical protein